MKPTFAAYKYACPEVDDKILRDYLSRLSDRYFGSFGEERLYLHLKGLSRLSSRNVIEILLEDKGDSKVDCTVMAFDYPSEFSLITGVLAGMGCSIVSGAVFTYKRNAKKHLAGSPSLQRRRLRNIDPDSFKRRRIIDHFSVVMDTALPFKVWEDELKGRMEEIVSLLERGDDKSVGEAKHRVNGMVAKRLSELDIEPELVLYPVQIEVDNEAGPYTRLKVISEDTPLFLYALTNALSLHGISIEQVKIRTIKRHIEDEIDLVDAQGNKIEDPQAINQVKFSVLLTKQFTYFLGKAPDPYAALCRFDRLVEEFFKLPGQEGNLVELLSNPLALQNLARLLGTSDFLWEDFIRLQYETLLPILVSPDGRPDFSEPAKTLAEKLNHRLGGVLTREEKRKRFNEFKDREIFLLDLDQILNHKDNFRSFAEKLTDLAEIVVNKATEINYGLLVKRFGVPRTVAGLEVRFAVFGLGKLGGAALGYASDIELLFIYGDNGLTDGKKSIENREFFEHLVRETRQFIQAKKEGIFHVDLRLRPFGDSGPFACSLESFCRYYGRGGSSHSYERLALVRLRAIGGDRALGSRIERIRDEMIYATKSINPHELQDLREKQFREKTKSGKLNAKFSPGGLVDLEYDVQILQVMHGQDVPSLRTPRIHKALKALTKAGVLPEGESKRISAAYDFLRRLINGMRMLRGSAQDLFLPPLDSDEFGHLARRIGYEKKGTLEPAEQLRFDFEVHTASVRAFVEHHFGRDSLPGPATGNVADLILSDSIPDDLCQKILTDAGLQDPKRGYLNLRHLAGKDNRRDMFARLAVLALEILRCKPDPDMALNNWERFIRALPDPENHFNILLSQPMRLEILLDIFSGSQFLADILVKNPEFFEWVTTPENIHKIRTRKGLGRELRRLAKNSPNHREWLNELRRFRRREILRIGIRDICLKVSIREVMLELSRLAETFVQVVLERVWANLKEGGKVPKENGNLTEHFCILAFGKLGGNELNYSSDIDLLGVYDDSAIINDSGGGVSRSYAGYFARIMENVRSDLSLHTDEGYIYRVDLRLRPYGGAGELVPSLSGLINYYRSVASLWEIQAAIKMRPIAGNLRIGGKLVLQVRPFLIKQRDRNDIVRSIDTMRRSAIKTGINHLKTGMDVKSGVGGLRDVEFLVQGLQLINGPADPGLINGNTLVALEKLKQGGILPKIVVDQLKEDYAFLRRVEHYLQILEDRQIHALPQDHHEVTSLARRILGVSGEADRFIEQVKECLGRIREAYVTHLLKGDLLPPPF